MTREITHMKAFMAALESMGKNPLEIGEIPPTEGIVEKFFNDSTGDGDEGETDERGPWNEGSGIQFVTGPAKPIAEATEAEVRKELRNETAKGRRQPSDVPRSKRLRPSGSR